MKRADPLETIRLLERMIVVQNDIIALHLQMAQHTALLSASR